jgi:hypothetical protein
VNYKTRRRYDMEGSLATFVAVPTPGGIQAVALEPDVNVTLRPPAVIESGMEVTVTDWLRLFADYRFYDYTATFQEIDMRARQSGQLLSALRLNTSDVHSFRSGGIYSVSDATKIHFGFAYTSNGFPDEAITPGTLNLGGFDISGDIGKQVFEHYWLNVGVAGILGQERTIGPPRNAVNAGCYNGRGGMLGIGLRF